MKILRAALVIITILLGISSTAAAKTTFAYVANIGSNTVSVINTSTNVIVATVPVGDGPWGVAISPNGAFAYVVNNHDTATGDSVSVIKTATNTVVATVKVQSVPFAAVVTPNGKSVYVTNAASNTVSVINTATNTVIATIPVQQYPVGLAVAPNGSFVYVANNVSGSVSVISTVSNAVVTNITVGSNPIGVVVAPNGFTAYVTNSGSSSVSVISLPGNAISSTVPVSAGPFGTALTLDGKFLYVANSNGNIGHLVTVIDTGSLTVTKTITAGTGPEQVAMTPDGLFAYVTNITSNNVSVITTSNGTVTATIPVGAAPIGVAVTPGATVATGAGGFVGDGGLATASALGGPYGVVEDRNGNLYVSDFFRHRIRKITTAGKISTFAGTGISGYNGDNIPASAAMLSYPNGLVINSAGNLLVADGGNSRIREINLTSGIITTIAGNGVYGYSGDGGPATLAEMTQPFKLAFDRAGNLYTSDISNQVIRKIDTSGVITTYAGNGTAGYGGDGGPATSANLNFPRGVATDGAGNLYIGDTSNNRVRKVDIQGRITTFAGNGQSGVSGDGGQATNAAVGSPNTVIVQAGVLYISGAKSRIRNVILSTGIINTYAGSGYGYDGDGHPLLSSLFAGPRPYFDLSGSFLVADSLNSRLRKLVGGVMTTIAGGYLGDGGKATAGAFVLPESFRFDRNGNYYIADSGGNRVRKVTSTGAITTLAGNGINGYSGDGGPAAGAQLSYPAGVGVSSVGNIFISDNFNGAIREVSAGIISTFATDVGFSSLGAIAIDASDDLYVVDGGACVVWKITPAAQVSIAAGVQNVCGYNGDNIGATTAQLNSPFGVALDSRGNLYIADTSNNRVRKVNSTNQVISTLAGDGNCGFIDDVAATAGELCSPYDVAVSGSGAVYIADLSNVRIRQVVKGIISTYVGTGGFGFNGDGLNPLGTDLDDPVAVAVSPQGTVYFLDDVEQRVRFVH